MCLGKSEREREREREKERIYLKLPRIHFFLFFFFFEKLGVYLYLWTLAHLPRLDAPCRCAKLTLANINNFAIFPLFSFDFNLIFEGLLGLVLS